jgi:hypothetical protein
LRALDLIDCHHDDDSLLDDIETFGIRKGDMSVVLGHLARKSFTGSGTVSVYSQIH